MKIKTVSLKWLSLLALVPAVTAETVVYKVDPVHSGVEFKIRHFLSKVPGTFNNFSGEIHYDKDHPEKSKAKGEVKIASVDTNSEKRDSHLKSDDFFTASQYPVMTFESTRWEKVDDDEFEVTGDLTMGGQTHPVTFDLEFIGEMEKPDGSVISGWHGTTTIDRTKWGVSYGTPAVGEEVEIELNIEAPRQ